MLKIFCYDDTFNLPIRRRKKDMLSTTVKNLSNSTIKVLEYSKDMLFNTTEKLNSTISEYLSNSTAKPLGCTTDRMCRWYKTLKKCLPNPCLGNKTFGDDGQPIDYNNDYYQNANNYDNNSFYQWEHFWTTTIVGISFLAICGAGIAYYKYKQNKIISCQLGETESFSVDKANDLADGQGNFGEEVPLQIVTTM